MDIDNELKQTLGQLLKLCRDFGIQPRLIAAVWLCADLRAESGTLMISISPAAVTTSPIWLRFSNRWALTIKTNRNSKASKRIGNKTVEIHIAIDRVWDMTSNQTYTISSDSADVPIDDAGDLLAPAVSAEDLLILKLMPLRDRDLCDIIALLLDLPNIDAHTFWANCERTDNTSHIAARLRKLENALKSGDFREAWAEYYGEPLPRREILLPLTKCAHC